MLHVLTRSFPTRLSSDLSMFVEPADAQSAEYRAFWDKLRRGEYDTGQYRRIGKGGREVWIQASYNPVLDRSGRPVKVVKRSAEHTSELQSLMRISYAVFCLTKKKISIQHHICSSL